MGSGRQTSMPPSLGSAKKPRKAAKPKTKNKSGPAAFWDGFSGWKSVEAGDELLLGAEEGGFAGLEVLEDPTLIDPALFTSAAAAESDPDPPAAGKATKQALQKKGKGALKHTAAAPDEGADVAALKARLALLEQENKLLKEGQGKRKAQEQQQQPDGDAAHGKKQKQLVQDAAEKDSATDGQAHQQPAGVSKREQIKLRMKAKRQARKERRAEGKQRKQSEAAQPAQPADEQLADVSAWKPFSLQPKIERALALQGFVQPTDIQRECLPAAINERCDVIGAAQTGSGKTLAFGLPILQVLLQEREVLEASGVEDPHGRKLRALILTPTRELALQVCKHLQAVGKVCSVRVMAIVGGLAQVKQERLLAQHPEVVVATPGRLWELMRERQEHLADLSHLSFLVLDEADRMVQQGHFQELNHILDLVPRSGEVKRHTYDPDFEETLQQDTARRASGRGASHRQGGPEATEQADEHQVGEGDLDEEAAQQGGQAEGEDEGEEEEEEAAVAAQRRERSAAAGPSGSLQAQPKGQAAAASRQQQQHLLQTFVFSATLTLPVELRRRLRKHGGGGAGGGASLQSLMDRIVFRGEPRIIDLTTERRLATRVVEAQVHCTDEERDEVLYYLLIRHPGRTLVFMNAVSAVRRVAAILKLLGLPAHALHAQQQQRQRLKAVDRFKEHPQAILVATDVAARGLDIKDVRCVIHYQLPASADTYVHRSGRTARAGQDGIAISLVTPKEAPKWAALCRVMQQAESLPTFPVDRTVMPEVHRRLKLAMKLDEVLRAERKRRSEQSWSQTQAAALGIDLDGDDDASPGGGGSDDEDGRKATSATAKSLEAQLAALLAAPLAPKLSTRFFTGGAAAAVAHGAGLKATSSSAHVDSRDSVVPTETLNKAVFHASQLQQAKDANKVRRASKLQGSTAQAANAAPDAGTAGDDQVKKQSRKAKKAKKEQSVWRSPAQLARMALSRNEMKRKQKGRGLVVVPSAFGRDALGVDALQALRAKLG